MSDQDSKGVFEFFGEGAQSDLPPTSVTHIRQASIRTRILKTMATCLFVAGGLVVIVPLLPDTDTHAAAPVTHHEASLSDQDQSTGQTADNAAQAGAMRQDVVYMHPEPGHARERI